MSGSGKKELGQYYTVNEELQNWVYNQIKFKNQLTLEPSFGRGHLVIPLLDSNPKYPIIAYEIDSSLEPCVILGGHQHLFYEDFLTADIPNRFKTIIGNPPYVKVSRSKNLYIQFIESCFELLDEISEMIMIVPSDFIKLTSASKIIKKMLAVGSFTCFYFPNHEGLFENCNVDIMIFRYERGLLTDKVLVNGSQKYLINSNGIITFKDHISASSSAKRLEDIFDVFVGIVSGCDEVFRQPFGNIEVIIDKNIKERFIFIDSFPSGNPVIDGHLTSHKERLLSRRIKKFNENNWYEWGAPRNLKRIGENMGKECIYVRCLTRHSDPAFLGQVQYFGGTLLCLLPKKEMETDELEHYRDFINNGETMKDYIYSGRYKIGHKQICEMLVPNF